MKSKCSVRKQLLKALFPLRLGGQPEIDLEVIDRIISQEQNRWVSRHVIHDRCRPPSGVAMLGLLPFLIWRSKRNFTEESASETCKRSRAHIGNDRVLDWEIYGASVPGYCTFDHLVQPHTNMLLLWLLNVHLPDYEHIYPTQHCSRLCLLP